jgi:5'-nucleotidase
MNVNFPPVPPEQVVGVKVAPQGRRLQHTQVKLAKDPYGRDVLWIGDFPTDDPQNPNTDLGAILENMVSVTPLECDSTHEGTLPQTAARFADMKPARTKAARKRAAG